MKKFKTYEEVVNNFIWGSLETGTTYNGRMFYKGDTIYSYGYHFPICTRVFGPKGRIYLFTLAGYSNTTLRHKKCVQRALTDQPVVYVTKLHSGKTWNIIESSILDCIVDAENLNSKRKISSSTRYRRKIELETIYNIPKKIIKQFPLENLQNVVGMIKLADICNIKIP